MKENALILDLDPELTKDVYSFDKIIGGSPRMAEILHIAQKVKDYKTTILITGEPGTGKGFLAKTIHANSNRSSKPFLYLNCSSLTEKEMCCAIAGCVIRDDDGLKPQKGLLLDAEGGTFFLDEICQMPFSLQLKLLKIIQDEKFTPIGSHTPTPFNVRFIFANSKDVSTEVRAGKFLEELFYKINVVSIAMPPLRHRAEDIPALANMFLAKHNTRLGTKIKAIHPDAMAILQQYDWPGNIMELESTIERAITLTEGDTILPDVFADLKPKGIQDIPLETFDDRDLSIKKRSKILEKELIQRALVKTNGNKTQAAHILEISLPALLYKMKDYGLFTPSYSKDTPKEN